MANLKPGTNQDFAASMANAMERAFNQLLIKDGKNQLPHPIDATAEEVKDRRRLFAAIAQGVIAHLRDNPDAFHIANLNTASEHIEVKVNTSNMVI